MNRLSLLLLLSTAIVVSSCSSFSKTDNTQISEWTTGNDGNSLVALYAPIFQINNAINDYNHIGTAEALQTDINEYQIKINPEKPTFYFDKKQFSINGSSFTNLYYRVHFPEVPYSLLPFNLTAGKNSGLFTIITLNENKQPLLITNVHTCGCYLSFVPTSNLAKQSYPEGWPSTTQTIYGENLPAVIEWKSAADKKIIISLTDQTHRVQNISVFDHSVLPRFKINKATLLSIDKLDTLPLNDKTVSFYHQEGQLKGYVRGAFKPLEFFLMSWWALDPNIGMDKKLGNAEDTGTTFYTSLKPWQRKNSDLWNFPSFLRYWGWQL